MASVMDLTTRISLMRTAFADANMQLTRLKSDVERLAAVLTTLRKEKSAASRALATVRFDAQQRRREALASASQLERDKFERSQLARRLQQQLEEALREGTALDEYVKFMTVASQKLKAHIEELRLSKADLAESEAALSADMAVQAASLHSLTAQRDELMALNASLTVRVADLHQRLQATVDAIAAEDAANDVARSAAGRAVVPRDNARTEEVRLREELAAVQRQRDTVMRQALAVNASVSHVFTECAHSCFDCYPLPACFCFTKKNAPIAAG
jgi:chromosome segregation ATPase